MKLDLFIEQMLPCRPKTQDLDTCFVLERSSNNFISHAFRPSLTRPVSTKDYSTVLASHLGHKRTAFSKVMVAIHVRKIVKESSSLNITALLSLENH